MKIEPTEIGTDVLSFRHWFWEHLMAHVGLGLLFGAFYLRFVK